MNEALPLPEIPPIINEEVVDELNIYQFYKTINPNNFEINITNDTSVILDNIYNNVSENTNILQLQNNGTFLTKINKSFLYDINLTITTSESCKLSLSLIDNNNNTYMIGNKPVMYTVIKSSKSESKNMILKSLVNNNIGDIVKIMIKSYTNANDPINKIVISSASVIVN
jgi:hypothetical protein